VAPYRRAWSGRIISLLGDGFQLVALAAAALDLTQRTSGWGTLLMVQAVPRTVLMLLGGVVVDRFRQQAVIVATSLMQGVLAAALAALAGAGQLSTAHLYLYAAASGTASAFFLPASMSMVPEVLPPAQVRSGNALWSLAFNLAQLAGPPLAGVAVAAGGGAPAFALNATTFFAAAALFARVPRAPGGRAAGPAPGPWRRLREGLRAARRDPVIWLCVVLAPVYTLGSAGATTAGLASPGAGAAGSGGADAGARVRRHLPRVPGVLPG
jgi:MFS family permease